MRGSEFTFDGVDLLYYKLHKISLNRGRPYIDSPEWLKNKKSTINPKNNDDNCFQYAVTVALNSQNIKYNPERITNINPFIDQYDWKEINLHCIRMIGKCLNQITKQLLLMHYMFLIILKK